MIRIKNIFNISILQFMACLFIILAVPEEMEAGMLGGRKTPVQYETEIRQDFKEGNWAAGKVVLNKALALFPESSDLNCLMGEYYFTYKNYDKSRFYLIHATQIDNDNIEAKRYLEKVEEITKNYSSAICYINELLEWHPYDKALWLKKIALYKAQGNMIEADNLLKRLYQIYPNDRELRRRYEGHEEERLRRVQKSKDLDNSIKYVTSLIQSNPHKASYYLILCNLYLKSGNKEGALSAAERGIYILGGDIELARKKIGILEDLHRYSEAITFIKTYSKEYHTSALNSLLKNIEEESADDAVRNDAYSQYSRVYGSTHNNKALNYLINTAVARGYNNDAIYYIGISLKRNPRNVSLLYKLYSVYKEMGDSRHALATLKKVHALQPRNRDVSEEISLYYLDEANDMMISHLYEEAIPYLDKVIACNVSDETSRSALNKKYVCLVETKKYERAMQMLNEISPIDIGKESWYARKAFLLDKTGRTEDALAVLRQHGSQEDYELVAIPYIKKLIAQGAISKANEEAKRLLDVMPNSQLGLLYYINTSAQLKNDDEVQKYVNVARSYYPDNITFIVKQAALSTDKKDYVASVDLLDDYVDSLSGDSLLVGAYSVAIDGLANKMIKDHKAEDAISVFDKALRYDENNRILLYDKGRAFEATGQYDSAYVYQKHYNPSLLEAQGFKNHLKELLNRNFKNEVMVDYLQSRYGDTDDLRGVASIGYSRKDSSNVYGGTVNYAGRDGLTSGVDENTGAHGGTGVQLVGQWEHIFNDKWSTVLQLGWANRYFPEYYASLKLSRNLRNDWTVEILGSYRRVETSERVFRLDSTQISSSYDTTWAFDHWNMPKKNVLTLGAGARKEMWPIAGSMNGNVLFLNEKIYFNTSAQARYYPLEDRIASLLVQASMGTAPEADILNYGLPGSFSHVNTSVGLGGIYLFDSHLSGEILGTWYTFYNQTNVRIGDGAAYSDSTTMRYKNLFNIYLQLHVYF